MLSSDAFTTGMAVLMDRYSKVFQPPTLRVYFDLVRGLTDEEFLRGVMACIKRHAFFPSGQELLDAARPPRDLALDAETLWSATLTLVRSCPWRMIERSALDETAWKVVAATGGLEAIANMTQDAEPHVHRRFVEAYKSRMNMGGMVEPPALAVVDDRAAVLVGDVAKRLGGGR